MPTPQPTTLRLWPVLVAFGVVVVVTAVVVAVVVSTSGPEEPEPGPLGSLSVLAAVPVGEGVVRVVTKEGGCRQPVFADVRVRADAAELRVIGRSPGGGCTADIKVQCNEVRLSPEAARKRLVAVPVAVRARDVGNKTLVREYADGACLELRLR